MQFLLLKNLEEPHKNNYYFLIAHNLSNVIPTLRSRCNLMKKVSDTPLETYDK